MLQFVALLPSLARACSPTADHPTAAHRSMWFAPNIVGAIAPSSAVPPPDHFCGIRRRARVR
jgi:hypothetical protein